MSETSWRHWRIEDDGDRIAWVSFDRAGERANALGEEVLRELGEVVDALLARSPRAMILQSSKRSGFCMGADIREFERLTDVATATARIREVHGLLRRIETLPFPTCAKIHGFCLGGGLELALACRHRVALDAPDTRIGLPEILLGLHPGFGGTVRSIARSGVFQAMDVMLSGRQLDARAAVRARLIDRAVPARHLDRAARDFALNPRQVQQPPLLARLADSKIARPLVARAIARRAAQRARPEHYPAPFALIDLWRQYGGDRAAMLDAEAASIARLFATETSRQLQRLFFLRERLKGFGRGSPFQPASVHVLGAGTMGGDIAAWCALRGLTVTMQDRAAVHCAPAIKRAHGLFARRIRDPYVRQQARDRLRVDVAGTGLRRADVIVEAIVEDAAAKRVLFARIEAEARPDALLCTNTSSIPLEEIACELRQAERLVGLHFFNPVDRMQLVEVIGGGATSEVERARAAAFAVGLGRLPLPAANSPGFLVNRVLSPYLQEAMLLAEEGASAAEIDAAAVAFGMPMGPLELADTVGLDICQAVGRSLAALANSDVPASLERLAGTGRLGRKTDQGFYVYRRGKPIRPKVNRPRFAPGEIQDRLILRLLNEAMACLDDGVVADADLIDAGMVFATGFAPFRGGPLAHARALGFDRVRRDLADLAARHGPRFTPHAGWGGAP